jgi:hypothetical protein
VILAFCTLRVVPCKQYGFICRYQEMKTPLRLEKSSSKKNIPLKRTRDIKKETRP